MCITCPGPARQMKSAPTTGQLTPLPKEAGDESRPSHAESIGDSPPANSDSLCSIETGAGLERARTAGAYRTGWSVADRVDYHLCLLLFLCPGAWALESGAIRA